MNDRVEALRQSMSIGQVADDSARLSESRSRPAAGRPAVVGEHLEPARREIGYQMAADEASGASD